MISTCLLICLISEPCPLCGDDINIGDVIVAVLINNSGHYWDCRYSFIAGIHYDDRKITFNFRGKCPNPDESSSTFEVEEEFTYDVTCLHWNDIYWVHGVCCVKWTNEQTPTVV